MTLKIERALNNGKCIKSVKGLHEWLDHLSFDFISQGDPQVLCYNFY